MDEFGFTGKTMVIAGVVLAVVGGLLLLGERIPWLGNLPGDISIQRKNIRLSFPLATCVLLSIVISLILWFIRRLLR